MTIFLGIIIGTILTLVIGWVILMICVFNDWR
jgi:hypothetical protein